MLKLRRFILPPAAFALVALALLRGTVLGDKIVFELVDLMLFHSATEELAQASTSPNQWWYFWIGFIIFMGLFSILWGMLTYLAWRQKIGLLNNKKVTYETTYTYSSMSYTVDPEVKKNGMSFTDTLAGIGGAKIGELLQVLVAGVLLSIFLIYFVVGAVALSLLAITFLVGIFITIPTATSSVVLFTGAFIVGIVCVAIGYMIFSSIGEYSK